MTASQRDSWRHWAEKRLAWRRAGTRLKQHGGCCSGLHEGKLGYAWSMHTWERKGARLEEADSRGWRAW